MTELQKALEHPIWKDHEIGDKYFMDGESGWKIAYYPIFDTYAGPQLNLAGDRRYEAYEEPRALVERHMTPEGIDFREVPVYFLKKEL